MNDEEISTSSNAYGGDVGTVRGAGTGAVEL